MRDRDPKRLIEEPLITKNDPPVQRFLREPASGTVSGLREKYGMVLRFDLGSGNYYKVLKNDQHH
ncbi:hypothetical protein [Streptomyces sp. YIM S03343]